MSFSSEKIDEIADDLFRSEKNRETIPPLTERYPDMNINDAYRIQLAVLERKKKDRKERIVGKKIGLTSRGMQELIGVNEPDYGHITDKMVVREGEPIEVSALIQPKVEAEIAFIMKDHLGDQSVTVSDVLAKSVGVVPAIEVIDSRIEEWKIKIQDTVADNASSARVILGGRLTPIEGLDLRLVGMVLEKNGQVVSTGAGSAVLGNPAEAVAWLANKLSEFEVKISPGEFVMAGSLVSAVDVRSGDFVTATFDHIGHVTARFI